MKVLLIIDENSLLSEFASQNHSYFFGSIHIQVVECRQIMDLHSIQEIIRSQRFHLVLCILKGEFKGHFVEEAPLINTINHYVERKELESSDFFPYSYKIQPPDSIVNKTTAYFNVFLEITKAVSYTSAQSEMDRELKRLDVISTINYYIAYLCHEYRCNYYILNYPHEFPTHIILDILKKIE